MNLQSTPITLRQHHEAYLARTFIITMQIRPKKYGHWGCTKSDSAKMMKQERERDRQTKKKSWEAETPQLHTHLMTCHFRWDKYLTHTILLLNPSRKYPFAYACYMYRTSKLLLLASYIPKNARSLSIQQMVFFP